MSYGILTENARHMLFLAAAWIANVDGEEHDAEIDALCELRTALGLEPALARDLHQMARSAFEVDANQRAGCRGAPFADIIASVLTKGDVSGYFLREEAFLGSL